MREYFEKSFPELRKQREDKERFQKNMNTIGNLQNAPAGIATCATSRVGGYARSEAELDQIIDSMHEQEEEEKKMHSYAIIPPIMHDSQTRRYQFENNNGLLQNAMLHYKDQLLVNIWTAQEKDIYREKYLQHPKNFVFIASFLERKVRINIWD